MESLKRAIGSGGDEGGGTTTWFGELTGATQNESCCPSLSYKQRITGTVVCAVLAFLLIMVSTFFIAVPILFAILYSFGNLALILSTSFLVGPLKQLKTMFQASRVISTLLFFIALGLTLFSAIYLGAMLLTILMVIIQFLAFAWYVMSYIPFAQRMICGCVKGMV
eukprot:TRINITY_DN689_c0_g1_i1.p1 TRINITY_DN689_c0_g1~~TRINITY_DN689_c0_g1_i1.p1  ORF type:complete len:166 (-),score=28.99 TRINITY_DN689_c0_g1_i1:89-586(-)